METARRRMDGDKERADNMSQVNLLYSGTFKSKLSLSSLNHIPAWTLFVYWSSLDTQGSSKMSKNLCLLFYITITCQKFQNQKTKCQVNIQNFINYLTVYCWNGKGTTVLDHGEKEKNTNNFATIDHGVFAHQHPFCANLCDLNKSALLVDKMCIYLDWNKRNKYSANLVHTWMGIIFFNLPVHWLWLISMLQMDLSRSWMHENFQ